MRTGSWPQRRAITNIWGNGSWLSPGRHRMCCAIQFPNLSLRAKRSNPSLRVCGTMDCFVAVAPRNDDVWHLRKNPHSRDMICPSLSCRFSLSKQQATASVHPWFGASPIRLDYEIDQRPQLRRHLAVLWPQDLAGAGLCPVVWQHELEPSGGDVVSEQFVAHQHDAGACQRRI